MVKKSDAGLLILVSDIERYATGPVAPHLDAKDVTVDCLGRGWVSDAVGKRLLETAEAEWQHELQLKSEHATYLHERVARRRELMAKISADLGGGTTPESNARVFAAQREALQGFDEREPELDFYRWKDARPSMAGAR